ncbi:MAG: FtsQ-type POTRA domain-containing protein [Candidatus Peregrinibacteria bacterium]
MSIRPAFRLPRRFNRPVSRRTQRLVARRHAIPFRNRMAGRWRRWSKLFNRGVVSWRRAILQWSLITLAALLLLAAGILAFSPIGHIEEIRVTRTDPRLDIEEVQRVLSPLFGQSLVTVSGREVRQLLEEKVLDLQSVSVSKHYPSQLLVRVELAPLVARARVLSPEEEKLPSSASGGILGSITDRGTFASAPPGFPGSADLPLLYLVDWGVRPQPGSPILSREFLARMDQAVETLQSQFGQTVNRRTVYVRAQEFHILVGTVSLWFDTRSPLEDQLLRFRVFLRSVGLPEAKEYVDLRLADRVVYR